ncbi:MAG: YdeI/OmpD-associated family protein [Mariniphaga sp.]
MNEIWVGYYKISTGKPSVNYSNALEEALCYGWIDGLRRSIDESSYCIRFTPRKPRSIWSEVNIKKVEELITQGRMKPSGLAAFEKRKDVRSGIYSYENRPETLEEWLENQFKEHPKAWEFYMAQSLSYKKTTMFFVMSGKQQATKISRLGKLIEACEKGKRLF